MNYTLTIYVGSIEYKRFTLKASAAAATALKASAPKAVTLIRQKITELADTYSWTHADVTVGGVQNTVRARG